MLLLLFSVGLKLRLQSLIRIEVLAGSLLHMLITVGFVYLLLISLFKMETQVALMVGINIGNSHILVMGMGRVDCGAYDLVAQQQKRVIGLDSDPIKVEHHRKQGRRVLYADAEDPGLWSNLQLGGVHTIMLRCQN